MFDEDDLAYNQRKYEQERRGRRRSREEWEHYTAIKNRVGNYKLKKDIKKIRKAGKMSEFVKGMNVKVQPTQYGDIIKVGINKEEFLQNPFNERGWLNIDILTSKEGKKYAKINDYKANGEQPESEETEEIPF